MRKKRIIKWIVGLILAGCVMVITILLSCNAVVCNFSKGKVYECVDSIPKHEFGLLLGTTPKTRIGRRENQFFVYRIDAAEELFKKGKIKKILISGDENSLDGVNEVTCMRDSLIARGLPANCFILDGKGFRTKASVTRATNVYNIRSYIVISQRFHNERAIFLANHLDLDVRDIVGYNATDATSELAFITYLREYLARVKLFIDFI